MRRLFFALTFCLFCCVSAPLLAQEQPPTEPQFTDEVEVLSVESMFAPPLQGEDQVVNDHLTLSGRMSVDDENRVITTLDGAVYPFLDTFGNVWLINDSQTQGIIIYQGNVFLQTSDAQQATTYWTLNLETGEYTQRETE